MTGRASEIDSVLVNARYRYDRPETQTLYLGDLSFCMKDYETALSMYRLVKDDYKADKSMHHLAHTTLMMAACSVMMEMVT